MGVASTYRDVLARNLRAARSRLDISQQSLAARMRALGYEAWLHQTVGNVEKGKRRVTAEEILGLSYALETSVAALMMPTEDDRSVAFPAGQSVKVTSVRYSVIGYTDKSVRWADDLPEFSDPARRPVLTAPEWIYTLPTAQTPGFASPLPSEGGDGA